MPPITVAAIVLGLLPFFFHFNTSSSETLNGETVHETFRDYVAIGAGGLGLVCGVVAVLMATRAAKEKRSIQLAGAAAAELLCVFQLLRGFGVV